MSTHTMRTRVFLILLCILAYLSWPDPAGAQSRYRFFYGKVYEKGTKAPIPDVNLVVPGSRSGTVTDKKGAFSFYADSIPARLVVSHVGFETRTILLDETSYSLTLYLARSISELQEVEIKADLNEPFFRDQHYTVRDYEIDSGRVYLLIYRQRLANSELVCLDVYGDTVARSGPLTFAPEKLFRDCLGNLHVLCHDSGFQVYREGARLHTVHPVRLKKFEDVLKNCVAATPEVLFFQKVTDNGLGVEYYGINRLTLAKQELSRISDERKLKMLRRNADDTYLMNSRQPDSREDFVAWNYVHKILYRPVKTTLYRIGSFICIFNTPDKQMEFYDSVGNYSYKLALNADKVKDGRWTNDILTDESSGKVFTTFLKNGTCTVYRIDLNSGDLHRRLAVLHAYPEKVKVLNDYVYYLYNVPGEADNKVLYRQKL